MALFKVKYRKALSLLPLQAGGECTPQTLPRSLKENLTTLFSFLLLLLLYLIFKTEILRKEINFLRLK